MNEAASTDRKMTYSIYLHIPFCVHRCAYCDFNTYAGQEAAIPAYVEAICREIELVVRAAPGKLDVHTVFFGGGTPSLLNANQLDTILKTIRTSVNLKDSSEISLEANPGTVTQESLQDLHDLGFNRLSFGVQSIHPEELRQLERQHDPQDVLNSVHWARLAGFENLNLDLIYGLPEQTLERWQRTVKSILGLRPEHLSLYALSVEPGTPFGRWSKKGLLPMPEDDLAADMYEWSGEVLQAKGYEQYEISNWALRGRQCRHNLQYWRGDPYLGFGAGAHGWANGLRIANVLRIRSYIERMKEKWETHPFPISPATVSRTLISPYAEMQETMMTGLRLTREGVSAADFRLRFGRDVRDVFAKEIDALIAVGLLEWSGDNLRLTGRGRLLGNQVFMSFVG